MEHVVDRYRHKKFKKPINNETKVISSDHTTTNNDSVPKYSTNVSENSANLSGLNYVKSSISNIVVNSIETKLSSSNINTFGEQSKDISYAKVSEKNNIEPTTTTNLVTTSSILNNFNTKELTVSSQTNLATNLETNLAEESNQVQKSESGLNDKVNSSGGKYVCTYCNLACSKPSVLQKHIRAHTNERPYPCNSCGFSFKTRSNLYKHCRSRTHANRVMGNKVQEINSECDSADSPGKPETAPLPNETPVEITCQQNESEKQESEKTKLKPYKPRFHTANTFFDNDNCENSPQPISAENKQANPEMVLHINELIDKNTTIINTSNPYLYKRRSSVTDNVENQSESFTFYKYADQFSETSNEPLNLTSKNRKRCLSEVEPCAQKSLIKELLLKNLYADSNMQCPHCKMIFQTVTELELHKMRSCKGYIKNGSKYSRSNSVNVASILTNNKNAFDSMPQLQNTMFPLKSPGPFLGKTRLVDSDKHKSFSFEDGIQQFSKNNDLLISSQRYSLSPLTIPYDKVKRPSVKLFGGEVKITHTTGETKSFKIDVQDHESYNSEKNYSDYNATNMSENRVVKSTLQSGGTILQSNPSFCKQDILRSSPDVIRMYEHTVSSSIDISHIEKIKFSYNNGHNQENHPESEKMINGIDTNLAKYNKFTNILDFSQNAANLLAPNLKQLNVKLPGTSTPTKYTETSTALLSVSSKNNVIYGQSDKIDFKQEDYAATQKLSPSFYNRNGEMPKRNNFQMKFIENPAQNGNIMNPMNLLVNGKLVRYVPGIPGPVVAETPLEPLTTSVIQKTKLQKPNIMITPVESSPSEINKTEQDERLRKLEMLEVKIELHSPKPTEMRSPINNNVPKSPNNNPEVQPRKFSRPTSLALKPSMTSLKQHHGLTPTMFNQILISPDTPRGAKKSNEHFLNGNYFSYLGLKSSTKPVYCTLNKTQPFYVHHFKKLSMYSEWRQQDNKSDKFYVAAYDSRQNSHQYTLAGKYTADYIVHSSYKFTPDVTQTKDETTKSTAIFGGYESNEDYTYVRGRGRGRFVCEQCGIRCKKPSMLKKHIRTHSNERPYTCEHCNFSFKTKGNLTKHMKSKVHNKNTAAQQSDMPSSDSDTDDSGMDSSDESTRQQEHEAAYGLLSLSQKPASVKNLLLDTGIASIATVSAINSDEIITGASFMNPEQLVHVLKTNYVKNKFLDQSPINIFSPFKLSDTITTTSSSAEDDQVNQYLGKSNNISRPLTYPYTSINAPKSPDSQESDSVKSFDSQDRSIENKNIIHFNVIKRYNNVIANSNYKSGGAAYDSKFNKTPDSTSTAENKEKSYSTEENDSTVFGKRKFVNSDTQQVHKIQRNESEVNSEAPKQVLNLQKSEAVVMDLSVPQTIEKYRTQQIVNGQLAETDKLNKFYERTEIEPDLEQNSSNKTPNENYRPSQPLRNNEKLQNNDQLNVNYIIQESPATPDVTNKCNKSVEFDNSAMETLADIATKQEKLEKNSVAKNVASELLKLATQYEYSNGEEKVFLQSTKELNNLVVKSEENKSCTICSKNFNKPSQLRLHMNIHYLERPFRCESCSVSFRTKGHLQKHERSASHHNKLSSSPALASSEPRPFKCSDCNIAFRIHGHLAKHLRSKMHIMKLECLAKIPFGLYAELERSNSLLTEINTADGDQCLDSLKMLAKKVFINDPGKINQLETRSGEMIENDMDS